MTAARKAQATVAALVAVATLAALGTHTQVHVICRTADLSVVACPGGPTVLPPQANSWQWNGGLIVWFGCAALAGLALAVSWWSARRAGSAL